MRIVRSFFLLLTLCAWSGCGSVTLNMASNRFLSPETGARRFETGVQGVNRVTIVPDASAVPPDVNSPGFGGTDLDAYLGLGVAVTKHLDLFFSNGFGGVPVFGLEFQLLGPSYFEAKGGDFSLAVTAGGGYISQGSDAGFNIPIGPSSWKYGRQLWAEDASLIVGYRVGTWLLFYGGPFVTDYQASGTITQGTGSASTLLYPYAGNGLQTGGNFGFEFGRFIFYKLEFAVVRGEYNGSSRSKLDGGAVGGIRF